MAYQKTNFRPLKNHCKEERIPFAAQPTLRLWLMLALLLIALIGTLPYQANAHEIRPAVGDLKISTTAPAKVTVSMLGSSRTIMKNLLLK